MEVLHAHCAGLDVHKESVVACVRHMADSKVTTVVKTFKTTTQELMALSNWLSAEGATHIAMEASGVYWKPVWHILADGEFELVLANAAHVKNVPGFFFSSRRRHTILVSDWSSDVCSSDLANRRVRLACLVSHPIQYQAPLLRRIAQEPDIDLVVLYGSDFSVRGYRDAGFGVGVKWDVPLLDGYRHVFLPKLRDRGGVSVASPLNRGIVRQLLGRDGRPACDALWVHGYATVNALHGMLAAKTLGIPVLLRAESWLRDRGRSGVKLALKSVFFAGLKTLVDGVLPIGTLNAEYWRHYFGDEVRQFPMPYAVDNRHFAEQARAAEAGRSSLQAELDLDPGRPVILFASKLQPRKHCNHLIEAYAQLMQTAGSASSAYLAIVGDGEERAALE